mgnify:CR=1 FL=1
MCVCFPLFLIHICSLVTGFFLCLFVLVDWVSFNLIISSCVYPIIILTTKKKFHFLPTLFGFLSFHSLRLSVCFYCFWMQKKQPLHFSNFFWLHSNPPECSIGFIFALFLFYFDFFFFFNLFFSFYFFSNLLTPLNSLSIFNPIIT